MARPRKQLDAQRIEALASVGSPFEDIALDQNVQKSVIERRYADVVKKGHSKCRDRIRTVLVKQALGGNTAAAIFLAKVFCGMKEQGDTVINVSATATANGLVFTDEEKKRIEDFYTDIQRRAYQRTRSVTPPSGNGAPATPALN